MTEPRRRLKRNDTLDDAIQPTAPTPEGNPKMDNFYGSLVDQIYKPKAQVTKSKPSADLSRVVVQPAQKKRTKDQMTKSKPGDSDDENASIHQDSYGSVDEGGSSQDKFEKDFIDDGRSEAREMRQRLQDRKGQASSEEDHTFFSHDTPAQPDLEEDDPYESLPRGSKEDGNWRYNKDTDEYHLEDWFRLSAKQYNSLFQHQRVGVNWLYDLYNKKMGGVLGDDMGLGKTVQVATLLKGLFDSEQIRKVLIVVPATMKMYWQNELLKWCSGVENVMQFDDKKRADRLGQIKTLKKKGGILVTSYGMVTGERINLSEIRFDLVVVDEGHRAKNINTELRRNLVNLRVKGIRLSLSGTPIQNNLNELWSVFDFVQPKIFGSFNAFQTKYSEPIERGLVKGATQSDQLKSDMLSTKLREMYKAHFLRRTKDAIFTIRCAETLGRQLKLTELPLKTDLVVWLPLTQTQQRIYSFLIEFATKDLKDLQNPFFVLNYIKKLCLHPQLLACTNLDKKRNLGMVTWEEEQVCQMQDQLKEDQNVEWTKRTRTTNKEINKKQVKMCKALDVETSPLKDLPVDADVEADWGHRETKGGKAVKRQGETLFDRSQLKDLLTEIELADKDQQFDSTIEYSSKIMFLFKLLKDLRANGHRVLVFSMSKKILNIIENIINSGFLGLDQAMQPVKYMRIDGDTEIALREQICNYFNQDPTIFCGLLTTKVGGFGLNLTGADRAVILDPDWNPANDNQAVDRVFRIGQKRDVIVYRLLTIGTIEEKIYRRQIYKKGMTLATIDNGGSAQQDFDKYFSNTDLFDLFEYDPSNKRCETMELLLKRDGFPIVSTPCNESHVKYLRSMDLVQGLSLNSNLYSNNEATLQVAEPAVFEPGNAKKRLQRHDERPMDEKDAKRQSRVFSQVQQLDHFAYRKV